MRVLPQLFTLPIKVCLEKKAPEAWSKLITITRYKGKGDPLFRDNYRSLKLLDQVLNVIERVEDSIIGCHMK